MKLFCFYKSSSQSACYRVVILLKSMVQGSTQLIGEAQTSQKVCRHGRTFGLVNLFHAICSFCRDTMNNWSSTSDCICYTCKARLGSVGQLWRHKKLVHGWGPSMLLQCPYCSFAAAKMDAVDKHMVKRHPERRDSTPLSAIKTVARTRKSVDSESTRHRESGGERERSMSRESSSQRSSRSYSTDSRSRDTS